MLSNCEIQIAKDGSVFQTDDIKIIGHLCLIRKYRCDRVIKICTKL